MDVTTRLTNEVVELSERAEGGVLLETLVGRFVLDHDGRKAWLLIDGRHSIAEIADEIARTEELPFAEVAARLQDFCTRLADLGLVEDAILASAGE